MKESHYKLLQISLLFTDGQATGEVFIGQEKCSVMECFGLQEGLLYHFLAKKKKSASNFFKNQRYINNFLYFATQCEW